MKYKSIERDAVKNKYSIVFSLPVHEKPEVVIDQIVNIRSFNINCAIVIHISASFNYKSRFLEKDEFDSILFDLSDVYINPTHLRTEWGDIIQCHLSNFHYVESKVDFDYFVPIASNELFIKHGLVEIVKNSSWGGNITRIDENLNWKYKDNALNDDALKSMLKVVGGDMVFHGQIEGTFFEHGLMAEICDTIDRFYRFDKAHDIYIREEVYFATLANYLGKTHYKMNTAYMNWEKNGFVGWDEILIVLKRDDLFSVKRVNRDLYDVARTYVRQELCTSLSDINKFIPVRYIYFTGIKLRAKSIVFWIKNLMKNAINN